MKPPCYCRGCLSDDGLRCPAVEYWPRYSRVIFCVILRYFLRPFAFRFALFRPGCERGFMPGLFPSRSKVAHGIHLGLSIRLTGGAKVPDSRARRVLGPIHAVAV